MFTGIHDNKLVDKRMFTTLLTQLKAAVLVKAFFLKKVRSCSQKVKTNKNVILKALAVSTIEAFVIIIIVNGRLLTRSMFSCYLCKVIMLQQIVCVLLFTNTAALIAQAVL